MPQIFRKRQLLITQKTCRFVAPAGTTIVTGGRCSHGPPLNVVLYRQLALVPATLAVGHFIARIVTDVASFRRVNVPL